MSGSVGEDLQELVARARVATEARRANSEQRDRATRPKTRSTRAPRGGRAPSASDRRRASPRAKQPPTPYYVVLQVDPKAESEVIEAAYRRLARKYHPDVSGRTGATRTMQRLNEAYAVLGDPETRRKYDLAQKSRNA